MNKWLKILLAFIDLFNKEGKKKAMKTFTIRRGASNKDGVYGMFIDGNVPFAVTVEPEDKNNQANISCIPPGEYIAFLRKADTGRRKYDVWQLRGVPDRSAIQIHKGVTEDSSLGCIIVGESFEPYKSKSAGVMNSTKGFTEFMDRSKGQEEIKIIIEKCY